MRISDWSSDVCSSDRHDIVELGSDPVIGQRQRVADIGSEEADRDRPLRNPPDQGAGKHQQSHCGGHHPAHQQPTPSQHHAPRHSSCSMRSEEHTSELQSLMRISYAVFCLKKKKNTKQNTYTQIKATRKKKLYLKQQNETKQK